MHFVLTLIDIIQKGSWAAKIAGGLITLLATGGVGVVVYNTYSSVPNAATILLTIQEEAHLDTIRANYSIRVSAGIIDGFRGMYSFSGEYVGDGEIIAGIDLSDFSEGDIDVGWRNINLHLPPPQFTSCTITNFRLVDRSITLFTGANWDMLYRLATIDGYYSLTEMGIQNDLLGQAEQEAGEILKRMLEEATGKNVTVHPTQEGRGADSDPDCTPPFPEGWAKEDVNYAWVRVP